MDWNDTLNYLFYFCVVVAVVVCVYMFMYMSAMQACVYHGRYTVVRGKPGGVGPHLPPSLR